MKWKRNTQTKETQGGGEERVKIMIEFRMRRFRGEAGASQASSYTMDIEDAEALALLEGRKASMTTRYRLTERIDKEAQARGYDWAEVTKIRPAEA